MKKKRKPPKVKCGIRECNGRVVTLVGDCKWCSSSHCIKHRLPEDHDCPKLQVCKNSAAEANRRKLQEYKAVAPKVENI